MMVARFDMMVTPATITLLAALTMASGGASMILDQDSLIPMSVFVGGILFVSAVIWKAATQFQKLLGKFEKVDFRLDRLEDDIVELKEKKRPHGTTPPQ